MRKAMPAEIKTGGACGCKTIGLSMQACRSSPAARVEPQIGKPQPGSLGSRILSSTFTTLPRSSPQVVGNSCGKPGGDLALGHNRPVLDPVGVDQVDRVAVAAEGARSRRDVVGKN